MSTGYGWEGIRQYVRRCLVRAMYLSASEVAVSILGALYECSTFTFYLYLYLRRRRLCFYFGLFFCLFDCPSDNWKSGERILTKFLGGVGHGPRTNEFNFGDDSDHRPDPGVRSPKSVFTGLSNYQRILMKFYEQLGCDLETNWLQFGDDLHHYPDPGVRYGSRSGSGKNCRNDAILLCSWRSAEVCAVITIIIIVIIVRININPVYYHFVDVRNATRLVATRPTI